jgi:hypothetical protein
MFKTILFALLAVALTSLAVLKIKSTDRFSWPSSAHARIEESASILRTIEGPARWCYPSVNTNNLAGRLENSRALLGQCMANISAVSEFEEIYENAYIRRFYRATVDDFFCEVTLSTVWNNDRIVGSDCYYGLFQHSDDTGIGLTADPFG